jgi:hypothetical protein
MCLFAIERDPVDAHEPGLVRGLLPQTVRRAPDGWPLAGRPVDGSEADLSTGEDAREMKADGIVVEPHLKLLHRGMGPLAAYLAAGCRFLLGQRLTRN